MGDIRLVVPKWCPSCGGSSIDGVQLHAGDCVLLKVSNALKSRRGQVSAENAAHVEDERLANVADALLVATDDQLRAEFIRRPSLTAKWYGDDVLRALEAERDEWKRRAEAAERESADHWRAFCDSENDRVKAETDLAAWKTGKRSLLRDFIERGPGIAAAKPDNSVAWLDEDLLAADATAEDERRLK